MDNILRDYIPHLATFYRQTLAPYLPQELQENLSGVLAQLSSSLPDPLAQWLGYGGWGTYSTLKWVGRQLYNQFLSPPSSSSSRSTRSTRSSGYQTSSRRSEGLVDSLPFPLNTLLGNLSLDNLSLPTLITLAVTVLVSLRIMNYLRRAVFGVVFFVLKIVLTVGVVGALVFVWGGGLDAAQGQEQGGAQMGGRGRRTGQQGGWDGTGTGTRGRSGRGGWS
ncbi:MAG: hypothetical protein M1817_001602 [Caeruleum heppii]|nr:MAG: hypothetical protein M1817_001602 [Caeruleum heppii]